MSITREMTIIFIGFLFGLLNNVSVECLAVNWGTVSSHPLPPEMVVKLLQDDGFKKVKLFDNNPKILKALAGTGIEVMIAIPNLQLKTMANPANAKAWIKQNVTNYNVTSKDGVKITYVAIGNEPFLKDYKDMFVNVTFPALKNIQDALNDAGIGDVVKATVPFNADVYYSPSYNPVPSAGVFRGDVADTVQDILEYMDKNKAPFVVNIYPYLSVFYGEGQFPVDFAFFDGKATPLIDGSIKYTNVFDAMIDTLASALKGAGFKDMPIIVGEIGWPTDGDVYANVSMAERFYTGLVPKLLAEKGTPLRPGRIDVYFFALFDEDLKSILPGNFERSWGIYRYDGRPKFPLAITKDNKTLASTDIKYLRKQWCVLKSDAKNEAAISRAMTYACDRTDCTPIQSGSSCAGLTSSEKASYVFNSFYQGQDQNPASCAFNGLTTITTKDMSKGNCNFTIQIALKPALSPAPAPAPARTLRGTAASSPSSGGKSGGSSSTAGSGTAASVPGALPVVLVLVIALLAQI